MQSSYPEIFERDMACTEAEWLMWLPRAVGEHPMQCSASQALVEIDGGCLKLTWEKLPDRTIALMRLPRLGVRFEFERLNASSRLLFMKHFDLFTQRGGG